MLQFTLKAARVNAGLTLEEVASIVKKDKKTVNKYELDSSTIPYDLLEKLIKLYDIPLNHIFLGKESDFIGKQQQRILALTS